MNRESVIWFREWLTLVVNDVVVDCNGALALDRATSGSTARRFVSRKRILVSKARLSRRKSCSDHRDWRLRDRQGDVGLSRAPFRLRIVALGSAERHSRNQVTASHSSERLSATQ